MKKRPDEEDTAVLTKIGNPGKEQYPNDDYADCFARSVWDMHYYNDSIYIGAGDYWANRGPVDIWSFDTDNVFRKEYTVDDEMVDLFRSYDSKLFIPGRDAMESWTYGNFYTKEDGEWAKFRTIPNAIHVADIALYEGILFATITAESYNELLRSYDMGITWHTVARSYREQSEASYGWMVIQGDDLFITGTTDDGKFCLYRYSDGDMDVVAIKCKKSDRPFGRSVGYIDGILSVNNYNPCKIKPASPLIFMNTLSGIVEIVAQFKRKNVRDIIIRDTTCYVLTALSKGRSFYGAIYSSCDLKNWIKLSSFSTPALPCSFEYMDNVFYVGLGNRTQTHSDIESGSIYRK